MERKTPPFLNHNGELIKESVAIVKHISIGGIEQGLLIRGQNINKPVLLILHGGPGAPHIGHARHFQKELEKQFVVINWDQRGSGMSYNEDSPVASMNLEQFILDAEEVVIYIRKNFCNKKIALVGYSWGSLIGMHLIQRYPEHFYVYFGLSQFVNMHENSPLVYKMLMDKAEKNNDEKVLQELKKINIGNIQKSILELQKLSFELGGMHTDLKLGDTLVALCKTSGEYVQKDIENLGICAEFSRKTLSNEIIESCLFNTIIEVKVPLYFLVGRNDAVVSPYLSEKYLKYIIAPKKKIVWFENSAHDIMFSENGRFQSTIIEGTKEN